MCWKTQLWTVSRNLKKKSFSVLKITSVARNVLPLVVRMNLFSLSSPRQRSLFDSVLKAWIHARACHLFLLFFFVFPWDFLLLTFALCWGLFFLQCCSWDYRKVLLQSPPCVFVPSLWKAPQFVMPAIHAGTHVLRSAAWSIPKLSELGRLSRKRILPLPHCRASTTIHAGVARLVISWESLPLGHRESLLLKSAFWSFPVHRRFMVVSSRLAMTSSWFLVTSSSISGKSWVSFINL